VVLLHQGSDGEPVTRACDRGYPGCANGNFDKKYHYLTIEPDKLKAMTDGELLEEIVGYTAAHTDLLLTSDALGELRMRLVAE